MNEDYWFCGHCGTKLVEKRYYSENARFNRRTGLRLFRVYRECPKTSLWGKIRGDLHDRILIGEFSE